MGDGKLGRDSGGFWTEIGLACATTIVGVDYRI